MSRHLFVGADVAGDTKTNGLIDDGGIGVEMLSDNGSTTDGLYVAADHSPTDSDQIRIVLGTGGNMLVSPWISRRNVIAYSGQSGLAGTPCKQTVTIAGTSAAAGTVVLKFVRTGGPRPEFFSFATEIPASTAHTAADALVKAAFEAAVLPEWLNPVAVATAGATVVFSGAKRGDTTQSGGSWDYDPIQFELIVESYDGGTQTYVASATQPGDPGIGDGYSVLAYEKSLQGVSDGFYNRRNLPIAPATNALVGTAYDMITLVATKDGSTSPQIKGVDNLIEISIALPAGFSSATVLANLNDYLAGDFAAVSV